MVALTVYCWLLCLYPGSYRQEFGEEMTSVFGAARCALPRGLGAKVSFYGREFCGLLSGALGAHLNRLCGAATPFRRLDMQPQFRFPRSTVLLMLVIFAGVVLTIMKAASVAGGLAVWPSLVSVLAFMLLTMCTVAALVLGILHGLRRSGVHRLEDVQVKSNADR
ncbi:MAG TPA: hypothetical protein VLC12_07645 [Terriglobales bacterium]|nr:hypothetical protein [Terriglobales bacterium]